MKKMRDSESWNVASKAMSTVHSVLCLAHQMLVGTPAGTWINEEAENAYAAIIACHERHVEAEGRERAEAAAREADRDEYGQDAVIPARMGRVEDA